MDIPEQGGYSSICHEIKAVKISQSSVDGLTIVERHCISYSYNAGVFNHETPIKRSSLMRVQFVP